MWVHKKLWGDFMIVEKWRCSEMEPSGLVWDPLFRQVNFSTNSKWSQILVATWCFHVRAACQVWTIFCKGGKICHVQAFLDGKISRKCKIHRNWYKFGMCGWYGLGKPCKKVGIILSLWRCSCFTKWTAWEKGSGVECGMIVASVRRCTHWSSGVHDALGC